MPSICSVRHRLVLAIIACRISSDEEVNVKKTSGVGDEEGGGSVEATNTPGVQPAASREKVRARFWILVTRALHDRVAASVKPRPNERGRERTRRLPAASRVSSPYGVYWISSLGLLDGEAPSLESKMKSASLEPPKMMIPKFVAGLSIQLWTSVMPASLRATL